ncbi:MAG: CBS domain-containing protein [Sphingobacteriaceae bacterium]|nr:MAG: CBS domain-containing protein [Sphingobacteriaceae bacterium]
MLNQQLISAHITPLQSNQTVQEALALMDNTEKHQLPVVDEGIFQGILKEDDLLEADSSLTLNELMYDMHPFSVKAGEHIINAVKLSAGHNLDIIPVVDSEKNYVGTIDSDELFRQHARLSGASEMGGLIVLEIDKPQYSIGEISRLVETNDAHITQLNTFTEESTGRLTVTLRINKLEVSNIVATFQRYEYDVLYFFGKEEYENELQHNFRNLMNYLAI